MAVGTVTAVRRRWRGAVELDVATDRRRGPRLAYPALVGEPEPGDRVLLNVSALAHGPGHRRVRARRGAARPAAAGPAVDGTTRDAGHLVKARYTPLQTILLAVDEEASPHRAVMAAADDLDGMPVVTADLHSALPAILAGIHADRPDARVAYVMTDGGALPAWFSRTLDGLRDHLAGTVTAGPGVRRRPGGGHRAHRTARRPARAARRRRRSSRRARATSAPARRGASPGWRSARRSTRSPPSAAARSASLRISDADPRRATAASRTTA